MTSKRAALPETVGESGILIDGEPGTPEYDDAFVEAVCSLLESEELFLEYQKKALAEAEQHPWMEVAKRFVAHLEDAHGLS